jgi:hypothetical protein
MKKSFWGRLHVTIAVFKNKNIGDDSIRRRRADSERLSSALCPHVPRPDSPHPAPIWTPDFANHWSTRECIKAYRMLESRWSMDAVARVLRGRRRLGQCGMVKRDKGEEGGVTSSRTVRLLALALLGVWNGGSYLISPSQGL